MRRESHVRFWEGRGVKLPSATRLVVGFQHRRDAKRFVNDLKERLGRFDLSVHPDKDPAHRVRAVRPREPSGAGAGPTGDVRLPGLHALLREGPGRRFPARAQADRQTHVAHAAKNQGGTASPATSMRGRNRALVGTSPQRMAELFCRSDQLPVSATLCCPAEEIVASDPTPQVSEGPDQLGHAGPVDRDLLAEADDPTPMAEPTIGRQSDPREEPGARVGHVRIWCARRTGRR